MKNDTEITTASLVLQTNKYLLNENCKANNTTTKRHGSSPWKGENNAE